MFVNWWLTNNRALEGLGHGISLPWMTSQYIAWTQPHFTTIATILNRIILTFLCYNSIEGYKSRILITSKRSCIFCTYATTGVFGTWTNYINLVMFIFFCYPRSSNVVRYNLSFGLIGHFSFLKGDHIFLSLSLS